jgi:branched-chain amino acid transport system substrate-binding protein
VSAGSSRAVRALGIGALLIAGGALVAQRAGLFAPRALRIGTILPLTGADAAEGKAMRNAIRLAVDEVNRRGGVQGRPVELVDLDDASAPDKAVAAAKQLAADPRVIGAVPHYDPDCSMATQLVFDDAKLPNVLAAIPNREQLQIRSPVEFRVLPLGGVAMQHMATYAWDTLGARTFVFVRDESNLGLSMVNQIRGALSKPMGKIVTGEEIVRAGQPDLGALVTKIRAVAPQYVFFGGAPRQAGLLLAALRAAGVTSWFQTAAHEPSQAFLDAAGPAAEGALAVFHGLPPQDFDGGRTFLAAYAAESFPEPPATYGLYAYAATQALLGAMERSFLTRPSVAGSLGHETLDTALGKLHFHYLGSTYAKTAVYRVDGGHWRPIAATDAANKLVPYAAP